MRLMILLALLLVGCSSIVENCSFSENLQCEGFEFASNGTAGELIVHIKNTQLVDMRALAVNVSVQNMTFACTLNSQDLQSAHEAQINCPVAGNWTGDSTFLFSGSYQQPESRFSRTISGSVFARADAGWTSLAKVRSRKLILMPLALFFVACMVFAGLAVMDGARKV